MTSWTAVVPAFPQPDAMVSRLPRFLHPAAGRPLIWHTVAGLAAQEHRPERIFVLTHGDLIQNIFEDLPVEVAILGIDASGMGLPEAVSTLSAPVIVVDPTALLQGVSLRKLVEGDEDGAWLGALESAAGAARLPVESLATLLEEVDPLRVPSGILSPRGRIDSAPHLLTVRSRADLARVHHQLRDHLVRILMEGGVTFILPESVNVDVDVRISPDTVVYPGVVLEGQTTIGAETVVGPGCRIIDSWIGSGVELKGWNYIANTSVRNRAILEPYVRRGFD